MVKRKAKLYDSAAGYDLHAKHYDKSQGYLDSFEKDVLLKLLGDLWGKKVLDIGCGTGRLIRHLKNLGGFVSGVDISEEMLKKAREKYPDVEFKIGDIENLPYEDEVFDLAVSSFVVVHLGDLQRPFEEVARVLKEGGVFVLTNINQKKAPKLEGGVVIKSFYHRPQDIISALEAAFFKIEKEEFVYEDNVWINQVVRAVKL